MSPNKWVEISIIVEAELAEPIAEVFARFAPTGVVIESTQILSAPESVEGRAVGPLRVYCFIPLDNQFEHQRTELEKALWYLGRIRPFPEPHYRSIEQEDWNETWKKHYQPIPIGKRLIIIPAWIDTSYGSRIPIRIDPGMAFGTGTHPTTQLCLEILEALLDSCNRQERQNTEVIDIGCGTAILAIAALKLGAGRALGVDRDADAIYAASKNAKQNGITDNLELGIGSLSEILVDSFSISKAQLVVANILSSVLISMLDDGLKDLLAPGGFLILSGILEDQQPEMKAALNRNHLDIIESHQMEDWIALVCQSRKEM